MNEVLFEPLWLFEVGLCLLVCGVVVTNNPRGDLENKIKRLIWIAHNIILYGIEERIAL